MNQQKRVFNLKKKKKNKKEWKKQRVKSAGSMCVHGSKQRWKVVWFYMGKKEGAPRLSLDPGLSDLLGNECRQKRVALAKWGPHAWFDLAGLCFNSNNTRQAQSHLILSSTSNRFTTLLVWRMI